MFDAMSIAATGMQAQQTHVDTIANNLANVATLGFKRSRVGFLDLITRGAATSPLAEPKRLGAGVSISRIERLFSGGEVKKTDVPLDLAITGEGFFEATAADGARVFTRGGSFVVNADGQLTTSSGLVLRPGISLPQEAGAITITPQGRVMVTRAGAAVPVEAGTLELVRFANPAALTPLGDNSYRESEGSGEAISGRAGEDGVGSVRQGAHRQPAAFGVV